MRRSIAATVITMTTSLSGCTVVPSLSDATGAQDNGVFVGEVVNRIKCELMIAFDRKLDNDPFHQYMWLRDWTVKVDLTLQANEQGGVAPSGSYTAIKRSAVNSLAGPTNSPGVTLGTVAQFFTFTANANWGEQAVRTETVSFTLALKELDELQRRTPGSLFEKICGKNDKPELLGNLGLEEWIDASLAPVVAHSLLAGKHPAPQTGAKPAQPQIVSSPTSLPKPGGAFVEAFNLKPPAENAADLDKAVKQAAQAASGATGSFNATASAWKQIQTNFDKVKTYQTTYGDISTPAAISHLATQRSGLDKDWEDARATRNCALQQVCGNQYGDCSAFDGVKGKILDLCPVKAPEHKCGSKDDPNTITKAQQDGEITGAQQEYACALYAQDKAKDDFAKWLPVAQDAARRADVYAGNAKDLADFSAKLAGKAAPKPPDPPIDSIGHSVQFVLAYGAGVTPSWTLIAWKGPALNGPGASATLNRTNLLQMALGPSVDTGNTTNEQSRVLQNQTIFLSRP